MLFQDRPRLVLGGGWCCGSEPLPFFARTPHLETMHSLLDELVVPHRYRDDLKVPHHWSGGWLSPLFEELADIALVSCNRSSFIKRRKS
jgi:hypothetical protein